VNHARAQKAILLLVVVSSPSFALAIEVEALKVQRREVFEFTRKPTVARAGDRVTITFEAKDFCDATVAIEDADGGILRHLASGVLGPNAPDPFRRSSLKQSIVWDGKDDQERYVDDASRCVVRVSLGLKPRFERTLYWSPKKKAPGLAFPVVRAAPEGVYVLDGGTETPHIRLFDHEGTYVRTVHPMPAEKARGVKGLGWGTFPPNDIEVPLKAGSGGYRGAFLTVNGWQERDDLKKPKSVSSGVRAMAVHGKRLFVASQRLNRLATDGTTGGAPLSGPNTLIQAVVGGVHEWRGGIVNLPPRDMALSPDGKWIYLAGYVWTRSWNQGGICGVGRIPADGDGRLEPFVGTLVPYKKGSADGEFVIAMSVDTDAKGRVYVADWGNDRVQVFDAAGKHLKNIATTRPALVRVNRKTGAIWVFSWRVPYGRGFADGEYHHAPTPKVTRFASFENPKVEAAWPLPKVANWASDDPACRADVDFRTDPPTIWLTARPDGYRVDWRRTSLMRLLVPDGRQLKVKRDFTQDATRAVARLRPPGHSRWRLHVNPKSGRLYVAEDHYPAVIIVKGSSDLVEIDPKTGRSRIVSLAFDFEDMAFDLNGDAHLRGFGQVARYDGRTWRERPFDYGENRRISYQGLKAATAVGALQFPDAGNASSQMGGFWVSPRGHVVITSHNPKHYDPTKDSKRVAGGVSPAMKVAGLQLMPGRMDRCVVRVFDRFGRVLIADAVPGVGFNEGVAMDRDDNIYLMAVTPGSVDGKRYPEPYACTLMKVRPRTKVLTPKARIPLLKSEQPKRPYDVLAWRDTGNAWVEGLEWAFPGVGVDTQNMFAGSGKCHCVGNSRFCLDLYARSFAPEFARYDVVVIDTAGNAICRIGRYGNVDDGMPLVKAGGPPHPRSIGGDEVALMNARFTAVHTDRRLFIGDRGNERIVSVKLDYHATERVPLKDVSD